MPVPGVLPLAMIWSGLQPFFDFDPVPDSDPEAAQLHLALRYALSVEAARRVFDFDPVPDSDP